MAKARKRQQADDADAPSQTNNMNIGVYEKNDSKNNGNPIQRHKQNLKRTFRDFLNLRQGRLVKKITSYMELLQTTLHYLTCTSCTLVIVIVTVVSLSTFNDEEQQQQQQQSKLLSICMGYLFIGRPILSTLYVVCSGSGSGRSNTTTVMTRIIALSFLLSIICNQLPKFISALVSCFAVFVFGLASRQLGSNHHHQSSSTTSTSSKLEIQQASRQLGSHHHRHSSPEQSSKLEQQQQSPPQAHPPHRIQTIWTSLGLKERAVLGAITLVISLLIENFLIWVVSATYQPGIAGEYTPLQDNGRLILEQLAMKVYNVDAPWKAKRSLQILRNVLNVQWALVSSFGASLVCVELQLGQQQQSKQQQSQRTLAGIAFHALLTLASARIIRTISFALTVLPSQVQNCYASHFPSLPPNEWGEWLMIGFLPNTRGGCNDLILSGHATVTSTIACAFTSVASNTKFAIAVWTLVALDYGIESYEGLHYSVDMWLGCIVTCLLWQLTKSLEMVDDGTAGGSDEQDATIQANETAATKPPPLDAQVVGMYALPAIIAFGVLTVVPEAYINYFLILYSAWAGITMAKYGFTNFVQHVLLCELCFGLGAYL